MAEAGFLVCFIITLVEGFSKTGPNAMVMAAALIGIGLCSIAGEIKKK